MWRACSRSLLVAGCIATFQAMASQAQGFDASVLKVSAASSLGVTAFGSAVVVGRELVATNCHVLRAATRVEVEHAGRTWPARFKVGDADKDLCLLTVAGLPLPAERIRSSASLSVGESVAAIGYPAGAASTAQHGRVQALYGFRGGKVIQTSASFDQGASGGGLFTASGELVGLLTFKIPSGGAFHFAIPADWIAVVAESGRTDATSPELCAFWEHEPLSRTQFLNAVWHEANREWQLLYRYCIEWIRAEPDSAEARRAMMRAVNELLAR